MAAEFFYLPLETDFGDQLREVAAFRADVLFLPGSFADATLIAGQAERLGIRPTLLGGDAWSNRLLFKRGGPARTAYHADHCAPPAAFLERYRREFGAESDGCRAILAYDAVQAVAAALRALPPLSDADLTDGLDRTRDRLRNALAAVSFEGMAGWIRFDEHGDVRARRGHDGGDAGRRRPRAPALRLAGSALDGGRSSRPPLNWKVGLTLTVAFAAIAVLFLLVLIPFQREQRQRMLDRDQRLLQIAAREVRARPHLRRAERERRSRWPSTSPTWPRSRASCGSACSDRDLQASPPPPTAR